MSEFDEQHIPNFDLGETEGAKEEPVKTLSENIESAFEETVGFSENAETPAEILPQSAEKTGGTAKAEAPQKPFEDAFGWLNAALSAAAAMLLVSLFVFRVITVSGPSMCDTLNDQDKIIVSNLFYEPSFGDIVVIESDKLYNRVEKHYGELVIKRVIGVAGDVIRFDFEKGEVYRNNELLQEDYIKTKTTYRQNGWVESGVDYTVPENCVFLLGDNRNVSHDSRDLELLGFVDKNLILGRAIVRFAPIDKIKWL